MAPAVAVTMSNCHGRCDPVDVMEVRVTRLRWRWIGALGLIAALAAPAPARAQEAPRLALPLGCAPGQDCWPINLFDHDPGPGWRDYACGAMSYDGHDGTDFWIRDRAAMAAGVRVLAAAAGRVAGMRDGMDDVAVTPDNAAAIKGRECGNGVVVDHGGGWQTQYCHMRKGSVAVRDGETVAAGATLGLVGLSGNTPLPHLHFTVRRDGRPVDPFSGSDGAVACPAGVTVPPASAGLWRADVARQLGYAGGAIVNYGVAPGEPRYEDVEAGRLRATDLPAGSTTIVVWMTAAGVAVGDRVALRLQAPDGRVLATKEKVIEKPQIRVFDFVGVRVAKGLEPGLYRAELSVARARDGAVDRKTGRYQVAAP